MTEIKQPKHERPKYSASSGFAALLKGLGITIAATSYQSGRLYLLSATPSGGLNIDEQYHKQAMGLHYDGQTLILATHANIYRMRNILRPDQVMDNMFSDCFVPRTAHFTGRLNVHDVGMAPDGEIFFVNTSHNCIARVSDVHSFAPFWRPFFISDNVAEDRCHLNGMAMQDGAAAYATAISKSNTIDGWRDQRTKGGVVIDIAANKVICENLSMPHSPRLYRDRLWVLNSGSGELGWVEKETGTGLGKFVPLCFCPGFLRGLSFHGNYAFVGLSKPRYERFEGLALDDKLTKSASEPWCGVQVIDLDSGACVQWFRIDGSVSELYDVAVLAGIGCAKSLGFSDDASVSVITIAD